MQADSLVNKNGVVKTLKEWNEVPTEAVVEEVLSAVEEKPKKKVKKRK